MTTPSPSRVASRYLAARASYIVYVDDDGYVYDDRGDSVFIGEEYADRTFDLRDLPRSHPSYDQLRVLLDFPPERRVQLGLAAAANGDAKSTHFLLDTRSFLRMSERQVAYLLRLNQKLDILADHMPDGLNLLPTRSAEDAANLKVRRNLAPYEVERLAPYFDVVQDGSTTVLRSKKLNPQPGKVPVPTVPVFSPGQVKTQLEVLDRLLQTNPADVGFVQSIRTQLARGKVLSERQLAAVRRQLYMAEMRPDAEVFRPPAPRPS